MMKNYWKTAVTAVLAILIFVAWWENGGREWTFPPAAIEQKAEPQPDPYRDYDPRTSGAGSVLATTTADAEPAPMKPDAGPVPTRAVCTTFAEAQRVAEAAGGLPILAFLTGDGCAPCQVVKRTVWETAEFQEAMAGRVVLCQINVSRQPEEGRRFGTGNRVPYLFLCWDGERTGPAISGTPPLDWAISKIEQMLGDQEGRN